MYPIPEEQRLLEKLPGLLRREAADSGSCRTRIIDLIRQQERTRRTGLLISLLWDVQALVGETVNRDFIPVETEEAHRVPGRAARFEHLIARLELYKSSRPEKEFPSNLFRPEISVITHQGKRIPVVEVTRPFYGCTLCKEPTSGAYFLDYLIPRSAVDLNGTYQLSAEEAETYESGSLDLKQLYERLIT